MRSIALIEKLSQSNTNIHDWRNFDSNEIKEIKFSNLYVKIDQVEYNCFEGLFELERLDIRGGNIITDSQSKAIIDDLKKISSKDVVLLY